MTSGAGEYRELLVSGVMSPEKWQMLTEMLGGLGMSSETVTKDDEPVYDPALLSSKADFTEFGLQDDHVQGDAVLIGKAWGRLEKLYLYKKCPDYYLQTETDYDPGLYRDMPDFFNDIRYKYGNEPAGAEGLRLEVLEQFIQDVFERAKSHSTSALKDALPHRVGISIFQFWIDFATWKRKQATELNQD